ncbi:uncharacterized protein LOC100254849 [Vitis vinifera]|uniref:uncharacterized protein LOC100254849 n=1 Tax=Vitis vinifera TaxID=29760 RepID=UPI002882E7BC|nr:uncharacterized protein LOC100254849 [Vitis vinifera]
MLRRILHPGFAALLLLLVPITCKAKRNHQLCTSSCGNIHNISYPFRLKDDPESCGESEYELACENNRTILYLYSGKYKVEEIKYENFTIRVVDDFSSLPLDSCTYRNFTLQSPIRYWLSHENSALNFIDCEAPISSSDYVDMASCREIWRSGSQLVGRRLTIVLVQASMMGCDMGLAFIGASVSPPCALVAVLQFQGTSGLGL